MRLSKAMDGFLEDCRTRKLSEATVASYEGKLHLLVSLAIVESEDALHAFTEALVAKYFSTNVKKGNGIGTLLTKRVAVVEFARYCLRQRYLLADPTVHAPGYRTPYRLPRPFTNAERAKLMALTERDKQVERLVQGRRTYAWVRIPLPPAEVVLRALLYYSGLRVGTVVKIRLEDLQAAHGDTPSHIRVITKGDREIEVPIVPALAAILSDYIVAHTDLRPKSFLLSRRHGLPWTVKMAQHAVVGWGRAAGVPKATPHRFRHTVGRELLETGATLEETQRFMGHASIASTQIYRRVTNQAVADAALRRSQLLKAEEA